MTLAKCRSRDKLPRRVPSQMMLTDPARSLDVVAAAGRLGHGSGVLLRHYGTSDRTALAQALARVAARRRLVLVVAADWRLAARVGAAGLHLPEAMARHGVLAPLLGWVRRRDAVLTVAAHGSAGLARARRLGASAALLSPVFATASHPGAATIGAVRFSLWARRAGLPVLALGGMDCRRLRRLRHAAGLAAIGAFAG